MRKTWLVTGSNRGLGLATVQAERWLAVSRSVDV